MNGGAHTESEADRADGTAVWILDRTGAVIDDDAVRDALRDLVQATRGRGRGRSWAVLGELSPTEGTHDDENHRAVSHDRVGRLAVRLAVDVVVSVGAGRSSRALHQGAVLEGSWGDESRLVTDVDAAASMLREDIAAGDVVLVAGSGPTDLSVVVQSLLDDVRCAARRVDR